MITIISVRITKIPFFSSFNAVGAIYYTNDRQIAQPPPVKVCCRSGGIPPLPS